MPDVRIKLTVSPASAQITIDGAPVSSPYLANVPRDSRDHIIRVEAPGLEPHVEIVRYEGDITMLVTLTKAAGAAQAATTTAQVRTGPAFAAPAVPATTKATAAAAPPTQVPVTAVAPVAPPAGPGSAHKGSGAKPDIDKADPWGSGH